MLVTHRVGSLWRLNALNISNSATIASRIFRFRARRGRSSKHKKTFVVGGSKRHVFYVGV